MFIETISLVYRDIAIHNSTNRIHFRETIHAHELSVSVSNFSSIFLSIIAFRCFRYLYHNINPGTTNAKTPTPTQTPIAALASALRPLDALVESVTRAEVTVLDEGDEEVRKTAPKTVGTATLTTAVVPASAICTANDPFFPQMPQSGTLR